MIAVASYKKSFKEKNYERMQEKDYTKRYRNIKRARDERDNAYDFLRPVRIVDIFKTPDLYKAVGLLIAAQLTITTLAIATANETYAGALNLMALIMTALIVLFAVRTINRRQLMDPTRRRFKLSSVLFITSGMMVTLFITTLIFNSMGITPEVQPKQAANEILIAQFPLAMVIAMIIMVPIVEELVFRELLPYTFGPSIFAFIVMSGLFVFTHVPVGVAGWTSYGILAAGFLIARLKDNNIYTAVCVHMIWNAIILFVL